MGGGGGGAEEEEEEEEEEEVEDAGCGGACSGSGPRGSIEGGGLREEERVASSRVDARLKLFFCAQDFRDRRNAGHTPGARGDGARAEKR